VVEAGADVTAREEILQRVKVAISAPSAEVAETRAYRRTGTLSREQLADLFCRRVGEYRATVHRVAEADVPVTIASVCDGRRLAVAPGVPPAWRAGFAVDDGLSAAELDGVDGALTGCAAAIAETGTIVLTAGPLDGRRALTLVPDLHICVVHEAQIVELLPQALAMITADRLEHRPITFVSGPSATSDIELSRVEGVHGPRNLVVLVVKESQ
jgi:L-lactate dehydrogenase complex protein LldG